MKTVLGLDQIDEIKKLVNGRKIGLITNYSGVNSQWETNIDLFVRNGITIKTIFVPEHGMFGKGAAYDVADSVYPEYDIPMISLFHGEKQRPMDQDLEGIECLVYDIQDAGLRYYTYIYTLTYCMEAAARKGLEFILLDRPDPLGDGVYGGTLKPEYRSFTGDYGLPMRYGLTPGEYGRFFIKLKNLDIKYTVVLMKHYRRDMMYPDTGQLWNIPSPAIPDFQCMLFYSGGCLAGATTLSDGRGSSKPFQMYGAPYIRMHEFYKELKERIHDEDILFRERAFIPVERKYKEKICYGVEFATEKRDINFIPVILKLLKTAADLYPEDFHLMPDVGNKTHMSYLNGSTDADEYLTGKLEFSALMEKWNEESRIFKEYTEQFRLYQ